MLPRSALRCAGLCLLLGCPASPPAQKPQAAPAPKAPTSLPLRKARPVTQLKAPSFDTAFPALLEQRPVPDAPPGTISLMRVERAPTPESFLTSVILVPVVYLEPSQRRRIADQATCASTGEQTVALVDKAQPGTLVLKRAEIMEFPSGQACQYEASAARHEDPHDVINTVMQSPVGDFNVTCNIAKGDAEGRKACLSVLNAWRWKQTPAPGDAWEGKAYRGVIPKGYMIVKLPKEHLDQHVAHATFLTPIKYRDRQPEIMLQDLDYGEDPRSVLNTAIMCQRHAESAAQYMQEAQKESYRLGSAKLITYPLGTACQFVLHVEGLDYESTLNTVFQSNEGDVMSVCFQGWKGRDANRGCQEMLTHLTWRKD